jgi:acyl carrier protein
MTKIAKVPTKAPVKQGPAAKKSSVGKSTLLKELESVFQTAPKEFDVDENAEFHTKAMFERESGDSDEFAPAVSSRHMAFLDDAPEYQGKKTSAKVALDLSSDESQDDVNLGSSSQSESSGADSSQSDDEENLVYDPQSSKNDDMKKSRGGGADSSRVLEIVRQIKKEEDIKVTKVDFKEFERSAAASAQRDFLDCLLEFRIRLQKPLSIANRLPKQHMVRAFASISSEYLKKCESVIEECGSTLHSLLLLRSSLSSQFPGCQPIAAIPAEEFKIGSKRNAHVSSISFFFIRRISCPFFLPVCRTW